MMLEDISEMIDRTIASVDSEEKSAGIIVLKLKFADGDAIEIAFEGGFYPQMFVIQNDG